MRAKASGANLIRYFTRLQSNGDGRASYNHAALLTELPNGVLTEDSCEGARGVQCPVEGAGHFITHDRVDCCARGRAHSGSTPTDCPPAGIRLTPARQNNLSPMAPTIPLCLRFIEIEVASAARVPLTWSWCPVIPAPLQAQLMPIFTRDTSTSTISISRDTIYSNSLGGDAEAVVALLLPCLNLRLIALDARGHGENKALWKSSKLNFDSLADDLIA
jgi:hypothetical protein